MYLVTVVLARSAQRPRSCVCPTQREDDNDASSGCSFPSSSYSTSSGTPGSSGPQRVEQRGHTEAQHEGHRGSAEPPWQEKIPSSIPTLDAQYRPCFSTPARFLCPSSSSAPFPSSCFLSQTIDEQLVNHTDSKDGLEELHMGRVQAPELSSVSHTSQFSFFPIMLQHLPKSRTLDLPWTLRSRPMSWTWILQQKVA